MTLEQEFTTFYQEAFAELCGHLRRKYPRLAAEVEDFAQQAAQQTLEKVRREQFRPTEGWRAWLWTVASHRALDRFRSFEMAAFDVLLRLRSEPADAAPSPSEALSEKERRSRQGVTLSQILMEFCRWCEARPDGHKMKEVYERSLRGQKPADIAAAMGLRRGTVDQHLKRARDWVLERVRQADVHRSVFLTLHRCKPEA